MRSHRLTKSDVLAKDQLFATLDTTARRLYLDSQHSIILTDTVGFVRDLPHQLVAAFSATLEETAQADALLHVADVSQPDYEQRMEDVNRVLAEIGAADIPQLLLYNKIDLLPPDQRQPGALRNKSGRIAAVRLSVTPPRAAACMRARRPSMVVAMAVGWWAKSSMTVTPRTVPRTSSRRRTPLKAASASIACAGVMPMC